MLDLAKLARRYGYQHDERGFSVGAVRVTADPTDADCLCLSTCCPDAAQTLHDRGIGRVLFRAASRGYITLIVLQTQLGGLIQALESANRERIA